MAQIHVEEQQQLKWPDGWERTLISGRKAQASWKKTFKGYRDALVKELSRIGVTEALICYNLSPADRMDPGVAVYFSRAVTEDYSWQVALGIDSPASTLKEIDDAFRKKAMLHHPDRGGDIEVYRSLSQHRDKAKAWVLGTHKAEHEFVIPCDRFTETRLNLNAIRLALAAFRQLDRVGVPAILERTFKGFKVALPAHASEESHATVNA